MDITRALPAADAVLQLEPEELAPYLLEYLAANKARLYPTNMFGSRRAFKRTAPLMLE